MYLFPLSLIPYSFACLLVIRVLFSHWLLTSIFSARFIHPLNNYSFFLAFKKVDWRQRSTTSRGWSGWGCLTSRPRNYSARLPKKLTKWRKTMLVPSFQFDAVYVRGKTCWFRRQSTMLSSIMFCWCHDSSAWEPRRRLTMFVCELENYLSLLFFIPLKLQGGP